MHPMLRITSEFSRIAVAKICPESFAQAGAHDIAGEVCAPHFTFLADRVRRQVEVSLSTSPKALDSEVRQLEVRPGDRSGQIHSPHLEARQPRGDFGG